MNDLRLVLLAIGVIVLVLIWLLDLRRERTMQRQRTVLRQRQAGEPSASREADREAAQDVPPPASALPPMSPAPGRRPVTESRAAAAATEFIAIHVRAVSQSAFEPGALFAAAASAGLIYGQRQIFDMPGDDRSDDPLFSVANMLEPGTFVRPEEGARPTRGVTLFMCLPARAEAGMVFDLMLHTAELLALNVGGTVCGPDHAPLDARGAAALREKAVAASPVHVRR